MKRIIAVHLLNDFSGSPLVFSEAIKALAAQGHEVCLYTATPSGQGFLSNLPGVQYKKLQYSWKNGRIARLLAFLWSQWALWLVLYRRLRRSDIVYVNTLLPFGAALAGYLRGCTVVYHVHEVSIRPALMQHFLVWVAKLCARRVIFVSHYVASRFHFPKASVQVVYNSLSSDFIEQSLRITSPNLRPGFTVLMLCSLKAYKGVWEMLALANAMPDVRFELVLNADEASIAAFFEGTQLPANLFVFPATRHTLACFERAHLVLNLSRPDEWLETFGMTLLEAMQCGRPVIAPPAGGPLELVTHGREGYLVDGRQTDKLVAAVNSLRTNLPLYKAMAENALQKAATFSPEQFGRSVQAVFGTDVPATGNATNRKNIPAFGKSAMA